LLLLLIPSLSLRRVDGSQTVRTSDLRAIDHQAHVVVEEPIRGRPSVELRNLVSEGRSVVVASDNRVGTTSLRDVVRAVHAQARNLIHTHEPIGVRREVLVRTERRPTRILEQHTGVPRRNDGPAALLRDVRLVQLNRQIDQQFKRVVVAGAGANRGGSQRVVRVRGRNAVLQGRGDVRVNLIAEQVGSTAHGLSHDALDRLHIVNVVPLEVERLALIQNKHDVRRRQRLRRDGRVAGVVTDGHVRNRLDANAVTDLLDLTLVVAVANVRVNEDLAQRNLQAARPQLRNSRLDGTRVERHRLWFLS